MLMPSQKAEKLPATRPDRMLSDAPPSRDDETTSSTCAELVEVKTFTSSGMTAPASVPQVMIAESFHHIVVSPPSVGMSRREARKVRPMEMIDVSQTSDVSGCSKLKESALRYFADAKSWLMPYE